MAQRRHAPGSAAAEAAAMIRDAADKLLRKPAGSAKPASMASGSTEVSAASASASSRAATHIYASSIAVPPQSSIDQLESQLLERCLRVESFTQRDVVLQRRDDLEVEQMIMERMDSSYGPMQRARIQSRLQVRVEKGQTRLMHFSQAQQRAPTSQASTSQASAGAGPSTQSSANTNKLHEPDYVRVKNLALVKLSADEGEDHDLDTEAVDADPTLWEEITEMMGWVPHHTITRQGRRFRIREDAHHRTEVLLFHLYNADSTASAATPQRVSGTTVMQATTMLTLMDATGRRLEGLDTDPAKLTERACSDIVSLHDALRGLAEFGKDVE